MKPLPEDKESVIVSRGMRDDADQFSLEPPHVAEVRNGVFLKEGVISKRKGLQQAAASGGYTDKPIYVKKDGDRYFVQGDKGVRTHFNGSWTDLDSPALLNSQSKFIESPAVEGARQFDFDFDSTGNKASCWTALSKDGGTRAFYKIEFASGKVVSASVDTVIACRVKITDEYISIYSMPTAATSLIVLRWDISTETQAASVVLTLDTAADVTKEEYVVNKGNAAMCASDRSPVWVARPGLGLTIVTYGVRAANGTYGVRSALFNEDGGGSALGENIIVNGARIFDAYDGPSGVTMVYQDNTGALGYDLIVSQRAAGNIASETLRWVIPLSGSDNVFRASFWEDGTNQTVAFSLWSENVMADDGWDSSIPGNAAGNLNPRFVAVAYDIESRLLVDLGMNGSTDLSGNKTFYGEQIAGKPFVKDDTAYVTLAPLPLAPMLNAYGVKRQDLPLMNMPSNAIVYGSDGKVYGTLTANDGYPYDYHRTIHTEWVPPTKVVGDKVYLAARKIVAPGSDSGYSIIGHNGSGANLDAYFNQAYYSYKITSFGPPSCRYDVYEVDDETNSSFVRTPSSEFLAAATGVVYTQNQLGLASFLNAPQITGVQFLNSNLLPSQEGFPGASYQSYDSPVSQLQPPPEFDLNAVAGLITLNTWLESGGSLGSINYAYFLQGVQIVLKASVSSGLEVRSAPSESVYIPLAAYHPDSNNYSFGATEFRILFYAPSGLPQNTRAEVYAFTAQDDIGGYPQSVPQLVASEIVRRRPYSGESGPNSWYAIDVRLANFDPAIGAPSSTTARPEKIISETVAYPLYTEGGELAPDPIPQFRVAISANNRMFGLDDSYVYYSKPLEQSRPPEFPALFRQEATKRDPLGLAAMDDKVVVFYRESISIIFGRGPDATGQGGEFVIQDLPGNIGVKDPRSIVTVPQGVLFRSDRGFYMLDRGLNITYMGAVQDVIEGTKIVSAASIPRYGAVVFSLEQNGEIVREYGPNGPNSIEERPPAPYYGNGYQSGYAVAFFYERGDWGIFTNHDFCAMTQNDFGLIGVRSDWSIEESYAGYEDKETTSNTRQNLLYIRLPWIRGRGYQDNLGIKTATIIGRYYSEFMDDGTGRIDAGDLLVGAWFDYEYDYSFAQDFYSRRYIAPIDLVPSASGGRGVAAERFQLGFRLKRRKCQSVQLILSEVPTNTLNGQAYRVGRGFEISAVDFEKQLRPGAALLAAGRRK